METLRGVQRQWIFNDFSSSPNKPNIKFLRNYMDIQPLGQFSLVEADARSEFLIKFYALISIFPTITQWFKISSRPFQCFEDLILAELPCSSVAHALLG